MIILTGDVPFSPRFSRYATAGVGRVALMLTVLFWMIGPAFGGQTGEGLPLGPVYPYRSPLDLVAGTGTGSVYVINHTGASVVCIDLGSGAVKATVSLAGAPSGLVLDADGGRLFVTHGTADGAIDIIDTRTFILDGTIPAGHTPVAPCLSADRRTVYVCNRFTDEVAAYDIGSGKRIATLKVGREPIAAAVTPDGTTLLVVQHLPPQAAGAQVVAAQLDIIDLKTFKSSTTLSLPGGSTAVRDICIAPDGRFAYITHNIARFGVPTTQLERGWMNTSALSIIDVAKGSWLTTVLLDDIDLGAANPWGIACSADGLHLVVAHSGTHELSVIDRTALHETIDAIASGQATRSFARSLDQIPNDLGFIVGMRRRLALPGNGPRGVMLMGNEAIIAQYFSDSLARIDISGTGRTPVARSILVGAPVEPNLIRRGEIAFHDALLCFQQWQSCATCHPDARADAVNWDLLNDGIGNAKNTRTMLFSHETPPVMITGIRPRAEAAVRSGFRFIQFAVVPEDVSTAVDAYMRALRPVPSPYLVNGELSASAKRGEKIFATAGCIQCHSGPYKTNGNIVDVGTGPDELGITDFVTTPLLEVWRTAPYLFRGQAATMKEVFTRFNPEDKHGRTSSLTAQQMDDLVEYTLSL